MKILLLGATGRTGDHIINIALKRGFNVKCLARNVGRIKPQHGLEVYEGNPATKTDLEKAIVGCDYVISALNISRKTDFPWSGLKTPKDYLSSVASNIASIAQDINIKRIVICSAWGVAETRNEIPFWFKWFIDNSNIGVAYEDHERQEKIITSLKSDWTIVRPVGLTNSNKHQKVRETFEGLPKPSLTISRKSVAKYMVDSLTNDDLVKKKVVISKE